MKIRILSKNIDVTDSMGVKFYEKISRLDKYFKIEQEAVVKVSFIKNYSKVEISILNEIDIIKAEAIEKDMYNALDIVIEKLKNKLSKHKNKLTKRSRYLIRLDKSERLEYKPMSEEEAIINLETIGHEFYVFCNSLNGRLSILCKRKDGYYGLIEPI